MRKVSTTTFRVENVIKKKLNEEMEAFTENISLHTLKSKNIFLSLAGFFKCLFLQQTLK